MKSVLLCIPFLSPQLLQYFNSIPSSHDGGDVMGTRRSGVTQTVTICNCGSFWHTGILLGEWGWHKKVIAKQKHSILHPAVHNTWGALIGIWIWVLQRWGNTNLVLIITLYFCTAWHADIVHLSQGSYNRPQF